MLIASGLMYSSINFQIYFTNQYIFSGDKLQRSSLFERDILPHPLRSELKKSYVTEPTMFRSTKQPACGYPCFFNGLHYVFVVVVCNA